MINRWDIFAIIRCQIQFFIICKHQSCLGIPFWGDWLIEGIDFGIYLAIHMALIIYYWFFFFSGKLSQWILSYICASYMDLLPQKKRNKRKVKHLLRFVIFKSDSWNVLLFDLVRIYVHNFLHMQLLAR